MNKIIAHRIFSWPLNIFLIAPLHVLLCIIGLLFNICNSLHYKNYWTTHAQVMRLLPDDVKKKVLLFDEISIIKGLSLVLAASFAKFFNEIKRIKEITF